MTYIEIETSASVGLTSFVDGESNGQRMGLEGLEERKPKQKHAIYR